MLQIFNFAADFLDIHRELLLNLVVLPTSQILLVIYLEIDACQAVTILKSYTNH